MKICSQESMGYESSIGGLVPMHHSGQTSEVTLTDHNVSTSEPNMETNASLQPKQLTLRTKNFTKEIKELKETYSWVDLTLPHVKSWSQTYGPSYGTNAERYTVPYFEISPQLERDLEIATNELHNLFLRATDQVISRLEQFGRLFQIPEQLWPRVRKSWDTERNNILAGRFDLSVSESGIKLYEYNADSASCLLECGYLQNQWADAVKLPGRNTKSEYLFSSLVNRWKSKNIASVVHILCDDDAEEFYHAQYMMTAAEQAGLKCKLIKGFSELRWTHSGLIQDSDDCVLQHVWKTWSWRTVLDHLTDEEETYLLDNNESTTVHRDLNKTPNIVDVFLHPSITVFEPLWTLVPASKAILPVLSMLNPGHPLLLESHFALNKDLEESGFVTKPVTGRGGKAIALFSHEGFLIDSTHADIYRDDTQVFQKLCMLPMHDGRYVQTCTWCVGGEYSGVIMRHADTPIIGYTSEDYPVRVSTVTERLASRSVRHNRN